MFSKCKSLESLISQKTQDFTNCKAVINVYKYLLFIFESGYTIKDLNTESRKKNWNTFNYVWFPLPWEWVQRHWFLRWFLRAHMSHGQRALCAHETGFSELLMSSTWTYRIPGIYRYGISPPVAHVQRSPLCLGYSWWTSNLSFKFSLLG